ncbi:hypothetical protein B296_00057861 [Ensete ventricosum]|uniref:Uncharacterized protein n=1 Tax=Ensete ventricosum TaxID=4639 RepID=A0A426XPN2_ENSVE|nr:hypothetical protein B296_00057861 [Ensete ventricosum]
MGLVVTSTLPPHRSINPKPFALFKRSLSPHCPYAGGSVAHRHRLLAASARKRALQPLGDNPCELCPRVTAIAGGRCDACVRPYGCHAAGDCPCGSLPVQRALTTTDRPYRGLAVAGHSYRGPGRNRLPLQVA